ncbi:unnamed protein product [Trichobilharzia regenti]|nr:unnamed protein product [Trichobilharzia regenti]
MNNQLLPLIPQNRGTDVLHTLSISNNLNNSANFPSVGFICSLPSSTVTTPTPSIQPINSETTLQNSLCLSQADYTANMSTTNTIVVSSNAT